MKKCILSILVVWVAMLCHAQLVLENEAAVVYYMPKNEVAITLEYDVIEQTPGVFYQYAERYLGAKEVIAEETTTYMLSDVTTDLITSADHQREYKVTAGTGNNEQYLTLTEDGRLLGYGLENVGECKVEGEKLEARGERREARGERQELMPLLEEQFLASSVAKMATSNKKLGLVSVKVTGYSDVTMQDKNYDVDLISQKVLITVDGKQKQVPIPKGYNYMKDNNEIIKIQDKDNKNLVYIWVPVDNTQSVDNLLNAKIYYNLSKTYQKSP